MATHIDKVSNCLLNLFKNNNKVSNCLLYLFLNKIRNHEPGLLYKIKEFVKTPQVLFLITLSSNEDDLADYYYHVMDLPYAKSFVIKACIPIDISDDDVKTYFQHKYNHALIPDTYRNQTSHTVTVGDPMILNKSINDDEDIRIIGTRTVYEWQCNDRDSSYCDRHIDCRLQIEKKTTPPKLHTKSYQEINYYVTEGMDKIPPQPDVFIHIIDKERLNNDDLMRPGEKHYPIISPFCDEISDQYPMDESKFQKLNKTIHYRVIMDLEQCYVNHPIIHSRNYGDNPWVD